MWGTNKTHPGVPELLREKIVHLIKKHINKKKLLILMLYDYLIKFVRYVVLISFVPTIQYRFLKIFTDL